MHVVNRLGAAPEMILPWLQWYGAQYPTQLCGWMALDKLLNEAHTRRWARERGLRPWQYSLLRPLCPRAYRVRRWSLRSFMVTYRRRRSMWIDVERIEVPRPFPGWQMFAERLCNIAETIADVLEENPIPRPVSSRQPAGS